MSLYLPPSLRLTLRKVGFSTWIDHVPFAYDLVEALGPDIFVELGTQSGLSYFAFCQSVAEHGLSTRCFAVDTWRGDAHTDQYDESVFEDVRAHNEAYYASFSTLLRMYFEEALERFENDSIDLLHIDGYHTYDAVRGDFECWYPKVKPGGVMLFHDVVARLHDFGAWIFWKELSAQHETFLFHHGFGLGVLRKPAKAGAGMRRAPLLDLLFSKDEAEVASLRAFYVHAAEHLELRKKQARVELMRQKRSQRNER
jgi:hypothetical protein